MGLEEDARCTQVHRWALGVMFGRSLVALFEASSARSVNWEYGFVRELGRMRMWAVWVCGVVCAGLGWRRCKGFFGVRIACWFAQAVSI